MKNASNSSGSELCSGIWSKFALLAEIRDVNRGLNPLAYAIKVQSAESSNNYAISILAR